MKLKNLFKKQTGEYFYVFSVYDKYRLFRADSTQEAIAKLEDKFNPLLMYSSTDPILFLGSNDPSAPDGEHEIRLVNPSIFSDKVKLVKLKH